MPAGQPRRVGVVCCIHPDEEKSREAYEYFDARRPSIAKPRVEAIIGNERAYEEGLRFTRDGVNLNTVFPGDPDSPIYEERRAAELVKWAKDFDIVLDVHGNGIEGYDCVLLNQKANLTLRGLAGHLGFTNIITSPRTALSGALPHVALIELSPNTHLRPETIYRTAYQLAKGVQHWNGFPPPYKWYRHIRDIPHAEAVAVHPTPIPPFTPLPPHVVGKLGLVPDAHALGWTTENGLEPEVIGPSLDPWLTR